MLRPKMFAFVVVVVVGCHPENAQAQWFPDRAWVESWKSFSQTQRNYWDGQITLVENAMQQIPASHPSAASYIQTYSLRSENFVIWESAYQILDQMLNANQGLNNFTVPLIQAWSHQSDLYQNTAGQMIPYTYSSFQGGTSLTHHRPRNSV